MKVVRRKTDRIKKLSAALEDVGLKVAVGFPASKSSRSNIEKAIWNEFGTNRGIPERPFMRNTMRKNKNKYRDVLKKIAEGILNGDTDFRTAMNKLAILAQGDVQSEITSLRKPPNASSTIKKKGSSNPLIDTGAMRQAVTWELRK